MTDHLDEELRGDEQAAADQGYEVSLLKAQVGRLTREGAELRKMLGLHRGLREAPLEVPSWAARPESGARHEGIVVAQLTDTHFDEVIQPGEVMGLNAYNREIALKRLRLWAEKVATLPRQYMAGVDIAGLAVLATGDIFSGSIHQELRETNEDKLFASALFWIEQLLAALEMLEREFPRLVVGAVVGNHGRNSIKPIFKGRAHDNIEWLVWSVIRDRLADRGSKIEVLVSDSMDLNLPIYGRNHLLTHGDQFHGGSGISGAFAPLSLGTHRKSVRQLAAEMPMDLMVIGHFHQIIDLPGVTVGGSLKGYDEYAFGLNLRPEEAGQALWLTTPERGKINFMPVYVQDRASEGW